MPVDLLYRMQPQRRLAAEWLALAFALLLGGLVIGGFIVSEQCLICLAWTSGLAWLLLGLAGAGGLRLAQRRRRLLEEMAQARDAERAAVTERVELALNGANLGLWDWHLPTDRRTVDGRAIAKCERSSCHGAVLFVDLDNFKSLNDTMGHDVGDRLLEMVAFRLQQVTRESDTVARLGGDEFVILLEDLGEAPLLAAGHAELVAQKVLHALSLSYPLGGHELRSTPRIGAVLFGTGSHTINDLLRQADMAMYEAKAAGRNTFRFFDPRMQAALDENATLESDLRFALVRRELMLYYQPVVDPDARVTGVEALLRWQHPRRGLVMPGEFIPQAEKSGLIIEIGDWVLETACLQLVRWANSSQTAALTIAVNVSARQFRQPAYAERVLQIIERSGADASLLKLELTESMLLSDVEDIIAKMTLLKACGVGFSLDDFGTGYSSLSYLQRLPIDQLKIDRSFVQDMLHTPHASTIVRSIVTLAHSMGLSVVAEGVENREQWSWLRQIGCASLQGYLFGQAVLPHELSPMLGRALALYDAPSDLDLRRQPLLMLIP
jgi:diguanylate cyclase (GGDEF)-like protein